MLGLQGYHDHVHVLVNVLLAIYLCVHVLHEDMTQSKCGRDPLIFFSF